MWPLRWRRSKAEVGEGVLGAFLEGGLEVGEAGGAVGGEDDDFAVEGADVGGEAGDLGGDGAACGGSSRGLCG